MPKIIGTTLANHRSLTQQRLFDALSTLLSEYPFDAITMSQIAQKAEVGRTAIYNHFADKESLLLAFMHRATAEFAEVIQDALTDQESPVEQIRTYLRAYLELKDQFHLASGLSLSQQVSRENPGMLHEHAGVVEHMLFHLLEKAMSGNIIPRQNSMTLVALIHSSLAGISIPPPAEDGDNHFRERTITLVQAFILRAIGVPEDQIPSASATTTDAAADATPHDQETEAAVDSLAFMRCPVIRS